MKKRVNPYGKPEVNAKRWIPYLDLSLVRPRHIGSGKGFRVERRTSKRWKLIFKTKSASVALLFLEHEANWMRWLRGEEGTPNLKDMVTAAYKLGLMDGEERIGLEKVLNL